MLTGLKKLAHVGLRILSGGPSITPGELAVEQLTALLQKPDPVILEIGCNSGYDTIKFPRVFPQCSVYAFEADPRAAEAFRQSVSDPRIKLFECAVGDSDGTVVFYQSSGFHPLDGETAQIWDRSGSIRKPLGHLDMHPWCTFENSIEVPVTRLDTWAAKNCVGLIDLIWTDVQGAEVDVIHGGLETLKRTKYFYTEYNNRQMYEGQIGLNQILKLLPDFKVITCYADNVLLLNRAFT